MLGFKTIEVGILIAAGGGCYPSSILHTADCYNTVITAGVRCHRLIIHLYAVVCSKLAVQIARTKTTPIPPTYYRQGRENFRKINTAQLRTCPRQVRHDTSDVEQYHSVDNKKENQQKPRLRSRCHVPPMLPPRTAANHHAHEGRNRRPCVTQRTSNPRAQIRSYTDNGCRCLPRLGVYDRIFYPSTTGLSEW